MNIEHVIQVVREVSDATPDAVRACMQKVDVVVLLTPWKEIGMPDDVRGMYEGTFPSEVDDELEIEPPEGTIYLVCDNLQDKADARAVLLHEMAHALGLDETEVAGLGL